MSINSFSQLGGSTQRTSHDQLIVPFQLTGIASSMTLPNSPVVGA
jgi:hypothetical protein